MERKDRRGPLSDDGVSSTGSGVCFHEGRPHCGELGQQGCWKGVQEVQEVLLLDSVGCPGRQTLRWHQECRVVGAVPGVGRLHLQSGQCDSVEGKLRGTLKHSDNFMQYDELRSWDPMNFLMLQNGGLWSRQGIGLEHETCFCLSGGTPSCRRQSGGQVGAVSGGPWSTHCKGGWQDAVRVGWLLGCCHPGVSEHWRTDLVGSTWEQMRGFKVAVAMARVRDETAAVSLGIVARILALELLFL